MFLKSPKRHFERVRNKNSTVMIAWTIENFSFNNCKMAVPLTSPLFSFPNEMKWMLFLYPRGKDNATEVVLELVLQTAAGYDYNINLSLLTSNRLILTKEYRMKFDDGTILSTGKLLNADFINNCLANDSLTVQCDISVVEAFGWLKDEEEAHLESLSADLFSLYISKKYSDLILIVNNENFHVHKSILSVRWPTLAEYLNFRNFEEMGASVIVPNVSPEIMKDLIVYVYSGKANFNISTEMVKAINMLELLSLKEHLSEFPHSYVARTFIPVERKTVVWNLGDVNFWDESQMPFIRVLPIEGINIHQIVLIFSTANHDGDEFLRVAFKLSRYNAEKPVLLKCESTLYDRTAIACHSGHHLFVDSDEWDFPDFVKKSHVMTGKNKGSRSKQSLEIELSMSDGKSFFNIEATDTDLYTESRSVSDLYGLKMDLSEMRPQLHLKGPLSDIYIYIWTKDSYEMKVHKAILWARWPESLTVLKENEIGFEVELDLDTLKELLHYIYYAETTKGFNPRNAEQILAVNKVAKMPSLLIEKCFDLLTAHI